MRRGGGFLECLIEAPYSISKVFSRLSLVGSRMADSLTGQGANCSASTASLVQPHGSTERDGRGCPFKDWRSWRSTRLQRQPAHAGLNRLYGRVKR
jgi:hypothetical protein